MAMALTLPVGCTRLSVTLRVTAMSNMCTPIVSSLILSTSLWYLRMDLATEQSAQRVEPDATRLLLLAEHAHEERREQRPEEIDEGTAEVHGENGVVRTAEISGDGRGWLRSSPSSAAPPHHGHHP